MVLHAKKSLFECIFPIKATNRPRKKMLSTQERNLLVIGGVIFFTVRSYIYAETEKYQFNCRKYTESCDYQRQLIMQSLLLLI